MVAGDSLLQSSTTRTSTASNATISHARAAVTIFGCTVSGGLVAIPGAYQAVGLAPSLLMSVIAGITTGLSLVALAMVSKRAGGVSTYGEVAGKLTGGPYLACFVDLLISVFLIGVLTGSFIVLRDWLASLVPTQELAFCATIGVAVFGMFPLALPRRIGMLAYSSFLSLAGFSLLVVVLLTYGIQEEMAEGSSSVTQNASSVWWPDTFDPLKLGLSFNVQIYSFACQFQLMSIFQDLRTRLHDGARTGHSTSPSLATAAASPVPCVRFDAVVGAAVSGMFCLFGLTGVLGVLAFPGVELSGDILATLDSKPLGPAVRGCLAVAIGLSGPLMIHPTREGFARFGALVAHRMGLVSARRAEVLSEKPPWCVHTVLTALIIALATTFALTFDKLMVLVSYLGAFLLCPLGLAFPALALVLLPPPASHVDDNEEAGATRITAGSISPLMTSSVGANWAVNEPSLLANKTSTSAGTGQGWRIWLLAAWLILVALTTVGVSVANLIVART